MTMSMLMLGICLDVAGEAGVDAGVGVSSTGDGGGYLCDDDDVEVNVSWCWRRQ